MAEPLAKMNHSKPTGLEPVPSLEIGAMEIVENNVTEAQGHQAEMPRSFSRLSSIAVGFGITNSWIAYLSSFAISLSYGGRPVVIFGCLIATFVQGFITLGLSEIASAFPSSGGQYHFVWVLAPLKTRRFAAFVIGWMTLLGWWIIACSGATLSAVSIIGMVSFWYPDLVLHAWQTWLVYVGVVCMTAAPVVLFPKAVPRIAQFVLTMSIVGFVICFTIVLAMKKQVVPGSTVTKLNQGTSGWPDGLGWFLGICNALFAYVGTDSPIHIAEEMHRPGRQIPEAMNTTILIGFLTTMPLMVAMMYTVADTDAVVNSALPSLEAFYQITGSKGVSTFMLAWTTVIYTVCVVPQWVTCGRMAWAFSRDNGLPFSDYFKHLHPKTKVPVRATVLSVVFCWIYGLLFIASSAAFNSIITSAVLYLNITYVVPQAILLARGRSTLPNRALNLGKLGLFCNVFSQIAVVCILVFTCFPSFDPIQISSMNWSSVVLVGLFGLIIVLFFVTGRNFQGPEIDMALISAANQQERDLSKRK
ncbi:hypothetical protein Z517_07073 [Fonsecaea pedrosoi CBS 271.37]|uniref:Unplaced genomic scaffold supercont1.4, whole genome shotgun sequence n=1 Tax=Fonsecaea pedrosoi CBS 271.37 TaxID=1442368 RepID=A0A0D2F1H5_9EURO|nr:uncharacterized protein Z517_07073 [Fonsecaea pedrosoi CBS 271.37]KIW80457.1 hypothetical protein Z517_07073 [Fonsecaea pedrosoi CBS 271.37]